MRTANLQLAHHGIALERSAQEMRPAIEPILLSESRD
jgi:hypothetical protein